MVKKWQLEEGRIVRLLEVSKVIRQTFVLYEFEEMSLGGSAKFFLDAVLDKIIEFVGTSVLKVSLMPAKMIET